MSYSLRKWALENGEIDAFELADGMFLASSVVLSMLVLNYYLGGGTSITRLLKLTGLANVNVLNITRTEMYGIIYGLVFGASNSNFEIIIDYSLRLIVYLAYIALIPHEIFKQTSVYNIVSRRAIRILLYALALVLGVAFIVIFILVLYKLVILIVYPVNSIGYLVRGFLSGLLISSMTVVINRFKSS
ncbi:hypothetical protein [Pyrofollis japonicus]|uniref:hypothetical protein n=1 Tax=Pyrofollis japonicus TaxID=3060460 RepID=UPI00295B9A5C|nr:hypothetical protein [Pyrofollis japonicus]